MKIDIINPDENVEIFDSTKNIIRNLITGFKGIKKIKYKIILIRIIKNENDYDSFKVESKSEKPDNSSLGIFFFTNQFFKKDNSQNTISIKCPIYFETFKNILKDRVFTYSSITYKNIELAQQGFLKNKINKKSIFLTETEKDIVFFFFENVIITKDKLKNEILYINKNIDTKSLESHLSRIRKKFLEVDADFTIIPEIDGKIKLS